MKQFLFLLFAMAGAASYAQPSSPLFITTTKTTSLIFPFSVRHVDRGSREVLVEQVKEADNILLIKAASADLGETNLSVITGDGSLYAFIIAYAVNPAVTVYQLPTQSRASMVTYANSIIDNPPTVRSIHSSAWDIKASVAGIYIKDDIMYYQLLFTNKSAIDYDIDFLRFSIHDKSRAKRTAIQERELTPLYVAGNVKKVKAGTRSALVLAFGKFTIPDHKYLSVQVGEKNGGRHLQLKIGNRHIIRAIPLPDIK